MLIVVYSGPLTEVENGARELGWPNIDEMMAYAEQIGAALP